MVINTKELAAENKKLKELNAMRTDLISLNAHQIRTDLSAAKWIIKMLLDGDYGNLTPEQEAALKKVYDSNEHAISLVSQMLSAGKAKSLKNLDEKYKFEKADIVPFLNSTITLFSAEARKKQIGLNFLNKGNKLPRVLIDRERLKIAIQNLIENAIKYNKPKGQVIISIKKSGSYLETAIKDTGIGISPENKEKIFDKFFRARNTEKTSGFGVGLGLWNSKKIIERHSGKIWVESALGKGSIFYFTIPIAKK
ncbi:hypothetical protein A3A09_03165 [Candidatus Nomurabacteria bacterium RIFCSPLOWO2_01_FULL_42_20]|uniref:histidine kinase n=1 Tax=Candidatus Nomurabacteria bacterium RIFCSPHIGHO2_01_FULL_42_16 TaxID=1801743 RepID=A0A1F6VLM3_9BACT|nr:MAG: hypothetical protein A2824_03355 [Candidatus Nomurabacteria bacterium RIFCSPHIGHO2_01_FULL_42_16]OGI92673.1 MAG: hypothetical protein A3A09_03165 [Candidatus Nomurabacteria bacterium RIFCSPLOWO2_01_FULL_42_20]